MDRWLAVSLLVALAGCSTASPSGPDLRADAGDAGPAPETDASVESSTDGAKPPAVDNKTFTGIYDAYFGLNSLGHCGNAGCHVTTRNNFLCSTKATCYQSMVQNGFIGTDASVQVLVDPQLSPLMWISGRGTMPEDQPIEKNDTATADLKMWISLGAPNN